MNARQDQLRRRAQETGIKRPRQVVGLVALVDLVALVVMLLLRLVLLVGEQPPEGLLEAE